MIVRYKYNVRSPVNVKTYNSFIEDFFEKHFDNFLDCDLMLIISSNLGDKNILYLDIDFRLNRVNSPDLNAKKVFEILLDIFGEDSFNLEYTPNGVHIVSNFIYENSGKKLIDIKHLLKPFLERIPNLDIHTSFSENPMKRIGYDSDKNFFYAPLIGTKYDFELRAKLFGKKNPYKKEVWKEYISRKLIPKDNIMTFNTLYKNLEMLYEKI